MSDNKSFIIDAAALNYTQVARPNKYNKWSVDVVVSKAEKKRIQKSFPDMKKTFKEYDPEEYKAHYKQDTPLPEEDEVFVLKVDQNVSLKSSKTGKELTFEQPKVYLDLGNGKAKEITYENVGNGSVGQVLVGVRKSQMDTGASADVLDLKAIRLTKHVEYQGGSSVAAATSAFGFTEVEEQEAPAQPEVDEDAPPFPTEDDNEDEY